jgi:hypothetical protein
LKVVGDPVAVPPYMYSFVTLFPLHVLVSSLRRIAAKPAAPCQRTHVRMQFALADIVICIAGVRVTQQKGISTELPFDACSNSDTVKHPSAKFQRSDGKTRLWYPIAGGMELRRSVACE